MDIRVLLVVLLGSAMAIFMICLCVMSFQTFIYKRKQMKVNKPGDEDGHIT